MIITNHIDNYSLSIGKVTGARLERIRIAKKLASSGECIPDGLPLCNPGKSCEDCWFEYISEDDKHGEGG